MQTGSFSVRLQTTIPSVIRGIQLLYADHVCSESEFADFHVKVEAASGLRKFIKPQVIFTLDGYSPFKPLPYDQAFPLLEWGLNWCVSTHAHDYLMIHAAVIEKDGFAAILPAPPGSGKSTLCAALIHRGWRLLSDELTLIRLDDGLLVPLPRPVSLKNQSVDVIRQFVVESIFSPSVRDTVKGTVAHLKPPSRSVEDGVNTARPAWIIFPKYRAAASTTLNPIAKADAFMRVADNSFNYSLLGQTGFMALVKVMNDANAYDFEYSNLDEAISVFANLPLVQT